MPARSNLFQDVVAILHRHMASGATVDESAFLTDRTTGQPREVDVVIRSTVAGYETILSVEATSGKRHADVTWVEQVVAKHQSLPTHKLILVSEAGFSLEASRYADIHGAVALSPEVLGAADPAGEIVNKLRSIWPKIVTLKLEQVRIHVMQPGNPDVWFRAKPDHVLYLEDGTEVAAVLPYLQAHISKKWPEIADQIGLANISEDQNKFFQLELGGPHAKVDGVRHTFFVKYELADPPELHPVTSIEITGPVQIEVREVQLKHRRLGSVNFSQGQTTFGDREALLIATEGESGGKLSMRFRTPRNAQRRARKGRRRS